ARDRPDDAGRRPRPLPGRVHAGPAHLRPVLPRGVVVLPRGPRGAHRAAPPGPGGRWRRAAGAARRHGPAQRRPQPHHAGPRPALVPALRRPVAGRRPAHAVPGHPDGPRRRRHADLRDHRRRPPGDHRPARRRPGPARVGHRADRHPLPGARAHPGHRHGRDQLPAGRPGLPGRPRRRRAQHLEPLDARALPRQRGVGRGHARGLARRRADRHPRPRGHAGAGRPAADDHPAGLRVRRRPGRQRPAAADRPQPGPATQPQPAPGPGGHRLPDEQARRGVPAARLAAAVRRRRLEQRPDPAQHGRRAAGCAGPRGRAGRGAHDPDHRQGLPLPVPAAALRPAQLPGRGRLALRRQLADRRQRGERGAGARRPQLHRAERRPGPGPQRAARRRRRHPAGRRRHRRDPRGPAPRARPADGGGDQGRGGVRRQGRRHPGPPARQHLHLQHRAAARQRLPGPGELPAAGPARVLRAVRRRHGDDGPRRRHPVPGLGGLPARRARRRHLPGLHPGHARLARAPLLRLRLGALRADAGQRHGL
ncbi:MAG: FIG001454: Transglutaminase-like enzymes, putative cysteine proteases, partial [uncultured Friedmanniella sp.]